MNAEVRRILERHYREKREHRRVLNRGGRRYAGVTVSRFKRLTIYLRSDMLCLFCGHRFDLDDPSLFTLESEASLEHIKPRVCGGSSGYENLVLACRDCNSTRGERDIWSYLDKYQMERLKEILRRDLHPYWDKAAKILGDRTKLE